MYIYKIYKLLFPGGEVYIGKTKLKLSDRFGGPGSNYNKNTKVGKAIAKYGWENVKIFVLYENLSKEEAARLEIEEIQKHGGINHPLVLNAQSGGDNGFTISEDVKEQTSKSIIQYRIDHPTPLSDKTKEKISISLKQFFKDNPENKEKLSKNMKKRFEENPEFFEALYEKISIPVDQYSYDGKTLIASYKSFTDAAEKTGINKANIAKCANGQTLSIGGYRWRIHGKKYPVIQYDKRFKLENLDI